MITTWPAALKPQRCNPELRNFTKGGGRTGTGRQQRVYSDAGFWEITFGNFPARTRERVLAFRALIARLRQGEAVVVRVFDAYQCKGQEPIALSQAANLRATQISLAGIAADLEPGHHLTLGNRLHRVTEVAAQSEENVGLVTAVSGTNAWNDAGTWQDAVSVSSTVKILPPLRKAVAAGALVEFDDLKCLCELSDPSDGDLDLEYGRHGSPSITFLEAI